MAEEEQDVPFVCNLCLCELRDYRYKCGLCPDFDLCGDCLSKDDVVGTHDPSSHVLLKLCVESNPAARRSRRVVEQSTHSDTDEEATYDSAEKLTEILSVLDSFQFFSLNVEGMSDQLKMPISLIRQHMDRLILYESQQGSSETEQDDCPALRGCDDRENGSRVESEQPSRIDADLQSMWPSIEELAEDRIASNGTFPFLETVVGILYICLYVSHIVILFFYITSKCHSLRRWSRNAIGG